jgi:ABC-type uncharacterized transport system substrate-binding protein
LEENMASQPTIGFLGATTPTVWSAFVQAFEQRLGELGWTNGNNIRILADWAEGRHDRYLAIAQRFVGDKVDLIVTSGTAPALAAKKAIGNATNIALVVAAAGDPGRTGLVGGNVCGQSNDQTSLAIQRLDKFCNAVPRLKKVAVLGNVDSPNVPLEMREVEQEARRRGLEFMRVPIKKEATEKDIEDEITKLAVPAASNGPLMGLYVCTDPLITTHGKSINEAAASKKLPTMHAFRQYAETGGLMSYGPDLRVMFRQAAERVDELLRKKPPAPFAGACTVNVELVVNEPTAKALGLGAASTGADAVIK